MRLRVRGNRDREVTERPDELDEVDRAAALTPISLARISSESNRATGADLDGILAELGVIRSSGERRGTGVSTTNGARTVESETLRRNGAAGTTSNRNPAAGMSRASTPRSVPMNETS